MDFTEAVTYDNRREKAGLRRSKSADRPKTREVYMASTLRYQPGYRDDFSTATLKEAAREHGEARHLLRHAYGDDEGYVAIFSGVRVDGDKRLRYTRERFFKYPEELAAAIGHAEDCAQEHGREVYFCTHLLTEERRKKASAAPVRCLYAEIDGGQDGPLHNAVERYATAIVESSPGRYHVYIRLTHTITPEEAEHLNKRFARTVEGDPSGADLTQLLRVPGTPNNKYPDKPTVRTRRLLVDTSHDPDTLARVFVSLPKTDTRAPIREASTPVSIEDEELLERARNARGGAGERFRRLYDQGDFASFPSQSEADFDLHKTLAFWTAWDRERMELLFRNSALMREKYNRTDYREPTIEAAIAATRRAYQQPASVDSSLGEAIESLRAQGESLAWEGRSGPTDRHAYDALVEHAETYGTLKEKSVVVSMDVRALALASGVSRPTAHKALKRLEADRNLIRCTQQGEGAHASTYAILLPAQGLYTKPSSAVYVQPLRALRNPTPQTEKEYDKNGRKINHPQQYLLGRIGKNAALVLERVLTAGESGVTLRDVARSLARRPRDVRRRTVSKLLEANLITCGGDEEILRVVENFDYLLSQELLESGCLDAEERDRKRYAEAAEKWRMFLANENPPDEAPTEEEMQAERDAQVELALISFRDERSGPGLTFRSYRDGRTETFDYLINAVAHYHNSNPELWRQPVKRAYEIAVDGERE